MSRDNIKIGLGENGMELSCSVGLSVQWNPRYYLLHWTFEL
jgi:hypothetical protein